MMLHHASFHPSHRHLLSQINPFKIDFKTGKDNNITGSNAKCKIDKNLTFCMRIYDNVWDLAFCMRMYDFV